MNYKVNHLDLEKKKVAALIEKLLPITDWSAVKKDTYIFNKNSNNIYGFDQFVSFDTKMVEHGIVTYTSLKDGKEYEYNKVGWYYYDESIADEIEEYFTPKLWWSYKVGYQEDFWICVACNIEELYDRWVQEHGFTGTIEDFGEEIEYECINELDGYSIECR